MPNKIQFISQRRGIAGFVCVFSCTLVYDRMCACSSGQFRYARPISVRVCTHSAISFDSSSSFVVVALSFPLRKYPSNSLPVCEHRDSQPDFDIFFYGRRYKMKIKNASMFRLRTIFGRFRSSWTDKSRRLLFIARALTERSLSI